MLDKATMGKYLHEFPLFAVADDVNEDGLYVMHSYWLTILDCIRSTYLGY